jgi:hypothetical protein
VYVPKARGGIREGESGRDQTEHEQDAIHSNSLRTGGWTPHREAIQRNRSGVKLQFDGEVFRSSLSQQRPQRAVTAGLKGLESTVADIDGLLARD